VIYSDVPPVCQAKYVVVALLVIDCSHRSGLCRDVKYLSLMEYADGGLYQQSALWALNKPGFPHRGLTCLAITSCAGQSVVFLSY
jgi:hypothetical protein